MENHSPPATGANLLDGSVSMEGDPVSGDEPLVSGDRVASAPVGGAAASTPARELTPRQHEIERDLLRRGDQRPVFDADLVRRLRQRAKAELAAAADAAPDGAPIKIKKHSLAHAHACEGRLSADADVKFRWSVALVRGTVTHRAIERMIVEGYRTPPTELARQAIAELIATESHAGGAGEYLAGISSGEHHDLVRDVNDSLVKLETDWPPIRESWRPLVESRIRMNLSGVELEGKPDMMLGQPSGQEARRLIVDFKTGRETPDHLQDLRYYALLEALRSGTPPFRVATYYLDSGTFTAEDVDEALLELALDRLVDGARIIARLAGGAEPTLSPGAVCRFCPARGSCPVAERLPGAEADDG